MDTGALVSPYILALASAWLIAHIVKYSLSVKNHERNSLLTQLFISGGMPSSHAATTTAVWIVILLIDGAGSGLFALATLITLIVCYDAVKVRRSVGEQGAAIYALLAEQKSKVMPPRSARGHTPLEVLAGAVLGATIGSIVFFATL